MLLLQLATFISCCVIERNDFLELINQIKESIFIRRLFVVIIVCITIYFLRSMINVMLLTIIFIFLTTRIVHYLQKILKIPQKYIVLILYALIVAILYFTLNHYINELIHQTTKLVDTVYSFYEKPQDNNMVLKWISKNMGQFDLKNQAEAWINIALSYASNVGALGISIFVAFILSFFFSIEIDRVHNFSKLFLTSKLSWFWKELAYLGRKFVNTFGVVLETQFIIAIVNTLLTCIGLYILGFNQLFSLSILIFILSLIPVAGVIISCIPLAFIGYTMGGVQHVIYILIMIAVIHAVEAYLLNPKLMSSKTKLPIFYVFVVLFLSEQLFGVWGLIIGIPIFVFILDLLEVNVLEINKKISNDNEEKDT